LTLIVCALRDVQGTDTLSCRFLVPAGHAALSGHEWGTKVPQDDSQRTVIFHGDDSASDALSNIGTVHAVA